MKKLSSKYDVVLIGGSSGSLISIIKILESFEENIDLSVIIVLHQLKENSDRMRELLSGKTKVKTIIPNDKEIILKNRIYIAPPDYHLMIEKEQTFSYSFEDPINYSRPSIDLLFETAACAYGNRIIGILLSGSNSDGTKGLKKIRSFGGLSIVQDPCTADFPQMPESAIKNSGVDHVLSVKKIINYLTKTII